MIIEKERGQPRQMVGSQHQHCRGDHSRYQTVSGTHKGDQQADKRYQVAQEAVGNESRKQGGRVIARRQHSHERRGRRRQ